MLNVIVIGGGPAGMAAALHAAENGARVTIVEHRPDLGGQYWRSEGGAPITGRDAKRGEQLRRNVLTHPNIETRVRTSVWNLTYKNQVPTLRLVSGTHEEELTCDRLIMATGAHDRALPFPGWTTPGVMTAGGIQALLKGHAVLAGQDILLVGTGPFLLSVAAGLLEHGARVRIVEANSPARWFLHPFVLLGNPKKLVEAGYYYWRTRKAKRFRGVVSEVKPGLDISVTKGGLTYKFAADAVGVGVGFTPDLSVALSLGVECEIDDGNLVVKVSKHQETSLPHVYAAGEITGVGGVEASLVEGAIAGLAATGAEIPRKLMRRRTHWQRFAKALADVYRRPDWLAHVTPETVVCRCEEVTVAKIDSVLSDLLANDPRSVKLFSRTGMGMCQGRFCAQSVAAIVADRTGAAVGLSDLLTQRPIVSPIPLGLMSIPRENPTD